MTHLNVDIPLRLPLLDVTAGARWERVTIGESGAAVFRLTYPDTTQHYLKIAHGALAVDLEQEMQRLVWLAQRAPVPRVVGFSQDSAASYLLMANVPGCNATDPNLMAQPAPLVELLAVGLHMLHTLPIDSCPFPHYLDDEIDRARQRMEQGLVDETDFDADRVGRRAQDLFGELLATRPNSEEPVFTHGDYCLPNVMLHEGQLSGFVDLGRSGIGDRYRDLALAARSISRNLGPRWIAPFFHAYGLSAPDPAKLAFFQLLDEFF